MIIDGPIWYTRAHEVRCRRLHRPRNAGTAYRGDCVILHACQRADCGECAIGILNLTLDVVVWHSVTREQYDQIKATDARTPVLTLLFIAGYTDIEPEAEEAA